MSALVGSALISALAALLVAPAKRALAQGPKLRSAVGLPGAVHPRRSASSGAGTLSGRGSRRYGAAVRGGGRGWHRPHAVLTLRKVRIWVEWSKRRMREPSSTSRSDGWRRTASPTRRGKRDRNLEQSQFRELVARRAAVHGATSSLMPTIFSSAERASEIARGVSAGGGNRVRTSRSITSAAGKASLRAGR